MIAKGNNYFALQIGVRYTLFCSRVYFKILKFTIVKDCRNVLEIARYKTLRYKVSVNVPSRIRWVYEINHQSIPSSLTHIRSTYTIAKFHTSSKKFIHLLRYADSIDIYSSIDNASDNLVN